MNMKNSKSVHIVLEPTNTSFEVKFLILKFLTISVLFLKLLYEAIQISLIVTAGLDEDFNSKTGKVSTPLPSCSYSGFELIVTLIVIGTGVFAVLSETLTSAKIFESF